MKILSFLFLIFSLSINAQDGFQILEDKKKVNIPFRQINNLVFLDLKVNNVDLTFLLDTGVSETLLFSLENKEVVFENVEKNKIYRVRWKQLYRRHKIYSKQSRSQ